MHEFQETEFAGELNAFLTFHFKTPNHELITDSKACQVEVRSWGAASQVEFDPAQESMDVVLHYCTEGPNFKILEMNCDCILIMSDAANELV